MTIKDMEERTGMGRTNIRFYESEGLISPKRRENGYREYSEEDAAVLRKVKLLRLMEVPLEEVRTMCAGEKELAQVLEEHLAALEARQDRQERVKLLTEQMLRQGTDFGNMEPQAYLELLESGEDNLKQDVENRLNLPWRRYWARTLDFMLCVLLIDWVMSVYPYWEHLSGIFMLGALLLLEPLCLSLFATTPGKAIFGIRVTNVEEGRLSYNEALSRTWTVMWEGEALRIPIVAEYFRYKSLTAAEEGETLPWEWNSDLTFRDDKNWRYLLYFAALAGAIALDLWLTGGI